MIPDENRLQVVDALSVLGSFIYYGFGLGLYLYTGALYSLMIGIVLAALQGFLSAWWMRHHLKGPLETVWHNATWAVSKHNTKT